MSAAGISFGSLYTPGMSLTSHRAEAAGLAQGLAFGVMNTAWALGEVSRAVGRRGARGRHGATQLPTSWAPPSARSRWQRPIALQVGWSTACRT